MPDYNKRLANVHRALAAHKLDLMFLPCSASLHDVTGITREEPNYANTLYPGDWIAGAWISPTVRRCLRCRVCRPIPAIPPQALW